MRCPFCYGRLNQALHYSLYTTYICTDLDCLKDDMPRYQETYNNYPTYLIGRTIMLDNFYIQINFQENKTIISVLEVCIIKDSITINNAIKLDLRDIVSATQKIKTLMVFS